jgi:hypothetical protein
VEIFQYWRTLENKCFALAWLIGVTIVLFALGLLPMIDNYAHLIGFVFGFPLGFALMPNIWLGCNSKIQKVFVVIGCLVLTAGMLAILIVLFYVIGVYECPGCQYFNCVPLTSTFCRTSEVKITLELEY